MFEPWITIPADEVYIQMPLSLCDREVRIMFRDVKSIDNTIEQLQNLKELIGKRKE